MLLIGRQLQQYVTSCVHKLIVLVFANAANINISIYAKAVHNRCMYLNLIRR